MRSACLRVSLSLLVVVAGCTDGASSSSGTGGGGEGGGGGDGPVAVCTAGTAWQPGATAFVDATEAWGLRDLRVEGVRLAAVDFDGDGFPDLVVRRGGSLPDETFDPPACCATASCEAGTTCPARRTWLLRNTGNGSFEDVTHASGLIQNRAAANPGVWRPAEVFAFADVDNDGDLDVYTGRSDTAGQVATETSEVMLNQGDGTFVLGPETSALRVAVGDVPGGAAFVDYDRNGAVDLWVPQASHGGSPRQDRLYWGDGTGTFTDVVGVAGLTTQPWSDVAILNAGGAHTNAWSGLACDLNGDGDPELLASSYGRSPNHLWQATGAAGSHVFRNRSVEAGYAFDHRVDWTDNESARCHCKLHPADPDCAGVSAPTLIACEEDADAFRWSHGSDRQPFRLGGNSGSTICADVDNDGDMDLLTTEIVHWDVGSSSDPSELLLNDGAADVRFVRPGNEVTGLTREHAMVDWNDGDMTAAVFDFDNDGWPDAYVGASDYPGNYGLLFHQVAGAAGGPLFEAVPVELGIDHHRSHGVAVADFDQDGDLDVVVGHSRSRCGAPADCYDTTQVRLFENRLGQGGNWLQVTLEGAPGTNRSAIGARVTVRTADGVTRTQEVGGGHGHYGIQHDLTLHFGLGVSCEAEVSVRWPDAALSTETATLVSGHRFAWLQGTAPLPK